MDSVKQEKGIVVQIARNFEDVDVSVARLEKLVKAICNRFKLSEATVTIAIVSDAEIRRVNKEFLNRDHPTDCLSFDLSNGKTASAKADEGCSKSFELVVNAEKAVKEGKLRGHSAEAELALYITHSLLHNLGFDDSAPAQAEKMHQTEDKILQQQGYGPVYNTDSA